MKTTFNLKVIVKIAALASASVALSGCVYDLGLGYASDGYYDDEYGCDPYSDYDRYYDCDLGYGFNNIGYGGGWYDNYYYPGYGFVLFDNIGRRYPMSDPHRRYWGEKRHNWYRENRGRNGDSGRYQRRSRGYTEGAGSGAASWPERHSGRARDADDVQRSRDAHRQERSGRNDRRTGKSRSDYTVPVLDSQIVERARGSSDFGQRGRRKSVPDAGGHSTEHRGAYQQPSQHNSAGGSNATLSGPAPEPRLDRVRQQPIRKRDIGNGVEQPH